MLQSLGYNDTVREKCNKQYQTRISLSSTQQGFHDQATEAIRQEAKQSNTKDAAMVRLFSSRVGIFLRIKL